MTCSRWSPRTGRRPSRAAEPWRTAGNDLASVIGRSWWNPLPPPGGSGGGEFAQTLWVPAYFDVVTGQVPARCIPQRDDVPDISGIQRPLSVGTRSIPF